jgi:hypothetical protein
VARACSPTTDIRVGAAQTRSAAGAPAFLSSAQSCGQTASLLVSKDYGTGRQRWRLVKNE